MARKTRRVMACFLVRGFARNLLRVISILFCVAHAEALLGLLRVFSERAAQRPFHSNFSLNSFFRIFFDPFFVSARHRRFAPRGPRPASIGMPPDWRSAASVSGFLAPSAPDGFDAGLCFISAAN